MGFDEKKFRKELFHGMDKVLCTEGFSFKQKKGYYSKKTSFGEERVGIVLNSFGSLSGKLRFVFNSRFEELHQILFMNIPEFDCDKQDNFTMGRTMGDFEGFPHFIRLKETKEFELSLSMFKELYPISQKFFFEKYKSVSSLDRLLNNNLEEEIVGMPRFHRPYWGILTAYLNKNSKYNEIKSFYLKAYDHYDAPLRERYLSSLKILIDLTDNNKI